MPEEIEMTMKNYLVSDQIKEEEEDEEEEDDEEEEYADCAVDINTVEQEKVPLWNGFIAKPKEEESISMADKTVIDMLVKLMKLIAYLVTFAGVLLGAVLSKTIMLLMTSQLSPDKIATVKKDGLYLIMTIPPKERYLWIWALFVAYAIPELGTFIRSVRHILFKGHIRHETKNDLKMTTIAVTVMMETLHVIGVTFFVMEVLPSVDVVKGVMLTNCVCFMPAVLSAASYNGKDKQSQVAITMDILAILFQLSGFFLWPALYGVNNPRLWFIPPTLLLISCGWWMNFVFNNSKIRLIQILGNVKDKLKESDIFLYKLYVWISLYKILVFALTTCVILSGQGTDLKEFFGSTGDAFNPNRTMDAFELLPVKGSSFLFTAGDHKYQVKTIGSNVWWIIAGQVFFAYMCYGFSKFAYKVMISSFSFALPVIFIVPATIQLIVVMSGLRNENLNVFDWYLSGYVFFNGPFVYDYTKIFVDEWGWVWIFWLISQTWITVHVWSPKCERLSRTEKLFATPMYSDFLVEQSILLNRRRDKLEEQRKNTSEPHIIACATMWHESKPEMIEMLKSVLRMDQDCYMRHWVKERMKEDANSYTYETHIFFDSAFDVVRRTTVINSYVRDFLASVDKAVAAVYDNSKARIGPPQKSGTPYGGRLTYTLPCSTKLYVHLKNKEKIRHKKRWSQVMYMYYLLGYNLMEDQSLSSDEKRKKAENTFLLALDGDIDFKPEAVLLLLDLMRKNMNVGAACGRIHPVGSGLMVWYQAFEYAIGHWLQKATEHMIGCVLCSPGCFSLFRGSALMSDNVMKTYTTPAEEARHYVQYDQGEDRWLCTLLLQRGYRVEYSAASDAYTHCPETFNEFYTQRRRWIPSTMANIVDLLYDYKTVVRINNDISMLYIGYQLMLMVGTVIGPGTIFLLLVSAFNAAFKIDNWTSFYYNMIPIILYVVICLTLPEKFQLTSALILSGVYGLIMMAVLVGMLMQISEDGYLAPSTIFLYIVAGEIIIAGLIHPQEILCLLKGPIYYVTIPSMYLLLIIYSVCNLNVVTWGTREGPANPQEEDLEEAKKAVEQKKEGGFQFLLDKFSKKSKTEDEGAVEFSLGNFFKLMMCTHPKADSTAKEMAKISESLDVVGKRLESIEKNLEQGMPLGRLQRSTSRSSMDHHSEGDMGKEAMESKDERGYPSDIRGDMAKEEVEEEARDDLTNPYWIEDKALESSPLVVMDANEANFWKELIKLYLFPLKEDEKKKKEISAALRELRDKMVVTFLMLNALFVTVVFLLQLNKSKVHFNWPLDAKVNFTITVNKEIRVTKTYLELEPVGVLFIIFFSAILIVQFLAMFFHRFETLCHLISSTQLRRQKKEVEMMIEAGKNFTKQSAVQQSEFEQEQQFQSPTQVDMGGKLDRFLCQLKNSADEKKSLKEEKRRSLINRVASNTRDVIYPMSRRRNSNFKNMRLKEEAEEEM